MALHMLRAQAPESTLPTWFAGACALGLALSPLGRLVYAFARAIVWPKLRPHWVPAIAFLAARLARDEVLTLPPADRMGTGLFHDVDRDSNPGATASFDSRRRA